MPTELDEWDRDWLARHHTTAEYQRMCKELLERCARYAAEIEELYATRTRQAALIGQYAAELNELRTTRTSMKNELIARELRELEQSAAIDLTKQPRTTADDARELLIITGSIEAAPPTMPCAYPHCCDKAGNRCPRMFAGQCSGPREAKPCV
jgi:hypothetical protein